MHRKNQWIVSFAMAMVVASTLLYLLHYIVFADSHHIFIYLLGDIAFIPLEVLLVTLVIHELLRRRERRQLMEKLNMLIGTFYSELGTRLLLHFSDWDPAIAEKREYLIVKPDWTLKDFSNSRFELGKQEFRVDTARMDLPVLKSMIDQKRNFTVRLLENPNLMEHETFTELLRATFHLIEEIDSREKLEGLPPSDLEHLAGDISRVYSHLVTQWLEYMQYLKDNYPYLLSLAMRTNPYDASASAVVTKQA